MTHESQRIKIAEACGWKWDEKRITNGQALFSRYGRWGLSGELQDGLLRWLPDYLNDLNAMHEAEKVLNKDVTLYLDYARRLTEIGGGAYDALFTTAAQRAEAFLKTLGLWVEEPVSEATVGGLR